MGDLYADVVRMKNPWSQLVEKFPAYIGMVDLLDHFRQQLWFQNKQMWWQVCQGYFLHS